MRGTKVKFIPKKDRNESICTTCYLTVHPTQGLDLREAQDKHICEEINFGAILHPVLAKSK